MLSNIFTGIFDTTGETVIAVPQFILCIVVSLMIGAFITWVYTYKSRYTASFAITLAMLPAVVCIVIMMVNGNVGAGVAVAGAFSLVRFRSVPGTAKEIGTIFLAMAAGLIAVEEISRTTFHLQELTLPRKIPPWSALVQVFLSIVSLSGQRKPKS